MSTIANEVRRAVAPSIPPHWIDRLLKPAVLTRLRGLEVGALTIIDGTERHVFGRALPDEPEGVARQITGIDQIAHQRIDRRDRGEHCAFGQRPDKRAPLLGTPVGLRPAPELRGLRVGAPLQARIGDIGCLYGRAAVSASNTSQILTMLVTISA